jgi:hypothetical protein
MGLGRGYNISLVGEWQCKQIFGFSHQLQYATKGKGQQDFVINKRKRSSMEV